MASRKDPVARARGRKPAPVKKPFPWGFAAGAGVLVLFLGGILTYAAMHTGVGDKSSLAYARTQFSGLHSSDGLQRNHLTTAMNYPNSADTPPDGGNHNATPQSCQVYTVPIANEHAVHSLEHGAVWVTYNPDKLSPADVAVLKADVNGDPARLLSPYPGLKSAISLQAWGEQLFASSVKDPQIKKFLSIFTADKWAPEAGGTCVGTTASRAEAALPSASSSPAPSGSAVPSGSAAPSRSAAPSASPKK